MVKSFTPPAVPACHYELMAVHFSELVQQVGLNELANIDKQEIAVNFMPAAITGLTDGDLTVIHPPYSGKDAVLYGKQSYNEGLVAKLMLRAALQNGMKPGEVYNFQTFAAEYFLSPGSQFAGYHTESVVRIHPDVVTIDGNPLALPRVPSIVVDYGACLTGRSYIRDQMAFVSEGARPFTFLPFTRMHFTNKVLMHTYDNQYGKGMTDMVVHKKLYVGREDGVGHASRELITGQKSHGAPAGIVDIIIATGAQHTTKADLREGMEHAHDLLVDEGMLVLHALTRPTAEETGIRELTEWAYEAGFDPRHAIHYEATIRDVGNLLVTGHFANREAQVVVLKK